MLARRSRGLHLRNRGDILEYMQPLCGVRATVVRTQVMMVPRSRELNQEWGKMRPILRRQHGSIHSAACALPAVFFFLLGRTTVLRVVSYSRSTRDVMKMLESNT